MIKAKKGSEIKQRVFDFPMPKEVDVSYKIKSFNIESSNRSTKGIVVYEGLSDINGMCTVLVQGFEISEKGKIRYYPFYNNDFLLPLQYSFYKTDGKRYIHLFEGDDRKHYLFYQQYCNQSLIRLDSREFPLGVCYVQDIVVSKFNSYVFCKSLDDADILYKINSSDLDGVCYDMQIVPLSFAQEKARVEKLYSYKDSFFIVVKNLAGGFTLYARGDNSYGQLGLGVESTYVDDFTLIGLPELGNAQKVGLVLSYGVTFVIATYTDQSNRIFSFGHNHLSQLGYDSDSETVLSPLEVANIDEQVVEVVSDGYSSLFLSRLSIYACGGNRNGQICDQICHYKTLFKIDLLDNVISPKVKQLKR